MSAADVIYPEHSIMRLMQDACNVCGERPLLITPDERYSYADVYHWMRNLAGYFQSVLGLTPDSMIVISAMNSIHIPVALAAAQLVGARVALFSNTVGDEELSRKISLVKPNLVISSDPVQIESLEFMALDATLMLVSQSEMDMMSVDAVMREGAYDNGSSFVHASADAHIIVFSSGSTGEPKAIVNRGTSFALNGIAQCKWLELTSDDVLYLPVPLIHVFGITGLYTVLTAQASFATSSRYNAQQACELIQNAGVTVHLGVPTNFIRELRENEDGTWDFSTLRAGLVGGADCPAAVLEDFEKFYGCRIMQSYGMSETAATLTVTPLEYDVEERVATVGFCVEGAQVKVDSTTCEIMCKSASMMVGVLQPDGSIILDLDDGWYHTGDVGRVDERGMLTVTGRLKDVIVRGGVNVFPSEVEAAYAHNDDVAECCAFAIEDEELGERIGIAVVLQEGSKVTASELRVYAKKRIDKCKVPDVVIELEALPCLGNGKIDRMALQGLAREMSAA